MIFFFNPVKQYLRGCHVEQGSGLFVLLQNTTPIPRGGSGEGASVC